MEPAISLSGVLAALLLAGACFDPTRTCSTDADCVNGGTVRSGDEDLRRCRKSKRQESAGVLDRGDGPITATRHGEAHRVRPGRAGRRARRVPPRRERAGDGHLAQSGRERRVGEAAGARYRGERRDGSRRAAGSVRVGESGGVEPVLSRGTVPLASLPFEAFRAVVPLRGLGDGPQQQRGDRGRRAERDAVEVAVLGGAPIYTTPAIADDGTIVFGTSDGGSGSVYALADDGVERWAPTAVGPIKASPVLGYRMGGSSSCTLARAARAGNMLAIDFRDGSIVQLAQPGPGYAGPFLGTPAPLFRVRSRSKVPLALANGAKFVNIRPGSDPRTDRAFASVHQSDTS